MGDFKQLQVWQRSIAFATRIDRLALALVQQRRFGMADQIRRAAESIGANLAEGCGRGTPGEMRQYTRIARGSAHEVESLLLQAKSLRCIAEGDWHALYGDISEIGRMLTGLLRSI